MIIFIYSVSQNSKQHNKSDKANKIGDNAYNIQE